MLTLYRKRILSTFDEIFKLHKYQVGGANVRGISIF